MNQALHFMGMEPIKIDFPLGSFRVDGAKGKRAVTIEPLNDPEPDLYELGQQQLDKPAIGQVEAIPPASTKAKIQVKKIADDKFRREIKEKQKKRVTKKKAGIALPAHDDIKKTNGSESSFLLC